MMDTWDARDRRMTRVHSFLSRKVLEDAPTLRGTRSELRSDLRVVIPDNP